MHWDTAYRAKPIVSMVVAIMLEFEWNAVAKISFRLTQKTEGAVGGGGELERNWIATDRG